jgi:hypothetical protein
MTADEELARLERQITGNHGMTPAGECKNDLPPPQARKPEKARHSIELIVAMAAVLAITGFAVNSVRQMPDQQAKSLRDGLIGSAAGLLVGYAVGKIGP